MFVGGAGVGKTQLVKGKLASLPEDALSLAIAFNYFTDVVSFQKVQRRQHRGARSWASSSRVWGSKDAAALERLLPQCMQWLFCLLQGSSQWRASTSLYESATACAPPSTA
jgi:hypothetical protein